MNEWEKAQAGGLYDPGYKELAEQRRIAGELQYDYNLLRPCEKEKKQQLIRQLLGHVEGQIEVTPPFYCDYGCNISVGDAFYTNRNVTILDGAKVTFGDHVFIAPGCVFSTAGHPLDAGQRNRGLEIALPITVGNSVWFGANVTVLPGVTIGNNVVIGAGSVVNRDIPNGVIAAGVPCRVIRKIEEKDRLKYPVIE